MQLADLRAQLRFRLQEPQSTGRFSDAELDSYINRGQAEVADQLEPLVKTTSLSYTSGEATQPLPDDLLRIHRASIGGTTLRTTDPLALDATSTTWEGVTGTPTHYFIQGNDLRLYPIPDSAVTVDVTHSYLPADLVDDTDEVSLPGWMEEGVILYALGLALESDMDNRSGNAYQKYQIWLERAFRRLRHRTIEPSIRVSLSRMRESSQ